MFEIFHTEKNAKLVNKCFKVLFKIFRFILRMSCLHVYMFTLRKPSDLRGQKSSDLLELDDCEPQYGC